MLWRQMSKAKKQAEAPVKEEGGDATQETPSSGAFMTGTGDFAVTNEYTLYSTGMPASGEGKMDMA